MFKTNIKAILFFATMFINFESGLQAMDFDFFSKPKDSASTSFLKKNFQNLKYSKKQMALVLAPALATLASGIGFGYIALDKELPKIEVLNKYLTEAKYPKLNWWAQKADLGIQSFGYPLIVATALSSLLWLLSKTEAMNGIQLEKNEKIILITAIYAFSFVLLNGNNPKNQSFGKFAKYCAVYPIFLSTCVMMFVSNLVNKYNLKEAMQDYLSNYNPDEEKPGKDYMVQQMNVEQGTQISEDEKITVKNNKINTPKNLQTLFDELYVEYEKNGDSYLNTALKRLAEETKDLNIKLG